MCARAYARVCVRARTCARLGGRLGRELDSIEAAAELRFGIEGNLSR